MITIINHYNHAHCNHNHYNHSCYNHTEVGGEVGDQGCPAPSPTAGGNI